MTKREKDMREEIREYDASPGSMPPWFKTRDIELLLDTITTLRKQLKKREAQP